MFQIPYLMISQCMSYLKSDSNAGFVSSTVIVSISGHFLLKMVLDVLVNKNNGTKV
jgi:hypothetical protein